MRSSGVHITSETEHVVCYETVTFRGELLEYGCDFEGQVDVSRDYETGETFWECPECSLLHVGLIERAA